jgi:hypothetical protein
MEVVVQLRPEIARALQGLGPPTSESSEVASRLEQFGVELRALHPGASDPNLLPHFAVDVEDPETAQQVAETLRQSPAVLGAYVKPDAELP